MNTKLSTWVFPVAVLVLLILIYGRLGTTENQYLGGGDVVLSRETTSTVVVVGVTSTVVLTTSTISGAYICNMGYNEAYIDFGRSVASTTQNEFRAIRITSSTKPCEGPFYFHGTINGATQTGTTSISVVNFR